MVRNILIGYKAITVTSNTMENLITASINFTTDSSGSEFFCTLGLSNTIPLQEALESTYNMSYLLNEYEYENMVTPLNIPKLIFLHPQSMELTFLYYPCL